ncbi:MAG: hypothetical protein SFT93_04285 [Rickettsiaceae bacterium]|nr:hypothetical protein [Rickettsiaceae bacterium]
MRKKRPLYLNIDKYLEERKAIFSGKITTQGKGYVGRSIWQQNYPLKQLYAERSNIESIEITRKNNTKYDMVHITKIFNTTKKTLFYLSIFISMIMLLSGIYTPEFAQESKLSYIYQRFEFVILTMILMRILLRVAHLHQRKRINMSEWFIAAEELNIRVIYMLMMIVPICSILSSMYNGDEVVLLNTIVLSITKSNLGISELAHELYSGFSILLMISLLLDIVGIIYYHINKRDEQENYQS